MIKEFAKSKLSWILAASFAVVFFLAFYLVNLGYSSQIRLILIPKNETMGASIDTIAHNAKELADGRVKTTVKVVRKTSIIELSAFHRNKEQSRSIATNSVRNMISTLSQYYDIKNDLDMRIIGEPKIKKLSKQNYSLSVIISILAGIVLSFATFILADYFNRKSISGKSLFPEIFSEEKRERIFPKTDKDKKTVMEERTPETVPDIKKEIIKKDQASKTTPAVSFQKPAIHEKKSAAPENLPIGDAANIFKAKSGTNKNSDALKEKSIKEKLNRLISGSMAL